MPARDGIGLEQRPPPLFTCLPSCSLRRLGLRPAADRELVREARRKRPFSSARPHLIRRRLIAVMAPESPNRSAFGAPKILERKAGQLESHSTLVLHASQE